MVIVVVASLVLGALTSYAQGVLPGPLRPFANSASGWTVLTAFIVWRIGARTLPSAAFGLASFVALVLGYAIASELRGLYYSPVLFGVIGTIVGPFVGVAGVLLLTTTLVRRAGRPAPAILRVAVTLATAGAFFTFRAGSGAGPATFCLSNGSPGLRCPGGGG